MSRYDFDVIDLELGYESARPTEEPPATPEQAIAWTRWLLIAIGIVLFAATCLLFFQNWPEISRYFPAVFGA